jgi:hypothetical protein
MARVEREKAEYETIDAAIVRALAAAEDEDPTEVDVCLYDHLNPDALDGLYDSTDPEGTGWRFEFAAEGYDVTVRSDGRVSVT